MQMSNAWPGLKGRKPAEDGPDSGKQVKAETLREGLDLLQRQGIGPGRTKWRTGSEYKEGFRTREEEQDA